MRIPLDESLPRKLAVEISGHDVPTVQNQGFPGLKNGELLRRASGTYDVAVTGDRNLEFQQNLSQVSIGVVVLIAKNDRIETLRPLVPRLLAVLSSVQPGQLVRVQ